MCLFLNIPHARYFALSIANEKYKKGVKAFIYKKIGFVCPRKKMDRCCDFMKHSVVSM